MITLDELKDKLAKQLYGADYKELKAKGLCIQCGRPVIEHSYSEAGFKEVEITGLCEECFDENTGG